MPTVEKVSGGRVYIRPLGRQFKIGDREEVTKEQARYVCEERGDFVRVDENERVDSTPDEDASDGSDDGGGEGANGEGDETETSSAAEETAEGDSDAEPESVVNEDDELDEWHGWDEDSWLELGYEQRAADVAEGLVDDHLDAIEEADRSQTVLDAVEDRRTELEG